MRQDLQSGRGWSHVPQSASELKVGMGMGMGMGMGLLSLLGLDLGMGWSARQASAIHERARVWPILAGRACIRNVRAGSWFAHMGQPDMHPQSTSGLVCTISGSAGEGEQI